MALPQQTIKDWTAGFLTKFIRDLFLNQPPGFLPNLKAETITVTQRLRIQDELELTKEPTFRKIGTTGNPAFTNSWVNFDGGWEQAGFWRDPLGFIHLRGLIKNGTINQAAFTLPPGFRPPLGMVFPSVGNGAFGQVNVSADGAVIPAVGSNTYFSLSGVYFRTT